MEGIITIYITGDTHGDPGRFFEPALPCQDWTDKDKLIVAGDFGCIFGLGLTDEAKLDQLSQCTYEILFLDGNHECFPKIYSYPEENWCGGRVHRVRRNIRHLMRGQVYEIEGMRIFTMGGGYSIDQMYRIPGRSWWPEEMPTDAEYEEGLVNLRKARNRVDVIISHAAPSQSMQYLKQQGIFSVVFPQEAPLGAYLEKVARLTEHRHYYFGHIHMDAELPENRTALYYALYCLNTGEKIAGPTA